MGASHDKASDTIAAISTAAGPAGISAVRISGPDALAVADRLLPTGKKPASARPGGAFFHTDIVDPANGETIDDAIVLVFRAPHSYTGEDVAEIQGHGGAEPSRLLLEAVLSAGARQAEPGEFTLRAFLNGKLDLTQAEAVASFISAKSAIAARNARTQLDGATGAWIGERYRKLVELEADIEHTLDFDESEVPEAWTEDYKKRLLSEIEQLREKLHSCREGRIATEGALIVLCGAPNAGKSSLMNALLGQNRAIVNSRPGTTRDAIEEGFLLRGIAVRLVDTAGIRTGDDEIEAEGISRARNFIERADLIVSLVDGSDPDAGWIDPGKADAPVLKVATKLDAAPGGFLNHGAELAVSSMTGAGMDALKDRMVQMLGLDLERFDGLFSSIRQERELRSALAACEESLQLLDGGPELFVIAAARLRDAVSALGRMLGRVYDEDVLDAVFSRFCVGK